MTNSTNVIVPLSALSDNATKRTFGKRIIVKFGVIVSIYSVCRVLSGDNSLDLDDFFESRLRGASCIKIGIGREREY